MRLFIAIQFSEEVRRMLLSQIDMLRTQATAGNFTRPENLHLTLAFIGESERAGELRRAIDRCACPPFELAISGGGRFGSLYWVGVEKNPALSALAERLRAELRAEGFALEERAFKPHITIARQLEADRPVSVCAPRTAMTVSRISLMKSERINGKLVYTEIYGKKL
jgi:2'-5' RNA ligase